MIKNPSLKIIALLLVLSVTPASAQRLSKLSGTVTDARTKEILPFASVFLAGTSLGTAATADGKFLIQGVSPGKYVLNTSMLGFQMSSIPIVILNDTVVQIQLVADVKYLQEVVVNSKRVKNDPKLEAAFKKFFLGNTENSAKCSITNLDRILIDQENDILTARCYEPVIVENKALGYRLDYYLEVFELDYNRNHLYFSGTLRFTNMVPKSPHQAKVWLKERRSAYEGSLLHFIRSLKWNCLNEEGFVISLDNKITDGSALFMSNSTSFMGWKGKLKVIYKNEPTDRRYNGGWSSYQTSYYSITSNSGYVAIYNNGYYENIPDLTLEGYGGWAEKVAEMLPYDYEPGN